jgi:hypothetical protein
MATRTVVVASTASNKAKRYETAATTWGELKSQIRELLTGDLEAIVNPGHVTLSQDNSVLPEGDFKLYLIPTKNKAGAISEYEAGKLGKEISEALIEAARKANKEELDELKNSLVYEIESFFGVNLDVSCEKCDETLEEAKALASNR